MWNQAVNTDREVAASRPDIIIKNKKEKKNMHTDSCANTHRQKYCAEGSRKEATIQEFMYTDKMNVEHEMNGYTSNIWSHWNSKKMFKEILKKTFNRRNKKTAVLGTSRIIQKVLQSETGSLSGGERYHEQKACDKRGKR
jgi:hypothetical protein